MQEGDICAKSTQNRVSQAPETQHLSPDLGSTEKEGCKSLLVDNIRLYSKFLESGVFARRQ